jgi:Flp pilus assembly pilin Flp
MTNFAKLYAWLVAKAASNERGAGMAEYALLLALVAIATIAAWQGLASGLATLLSSVVSALN